MKTAIITGGSRGIGRACVLKFAQNGYDVFYCYSTADGNKIDLPVSGKVIGIKADVSKEEEVKFLIDTAFGQTGRIDVLVANAGISGYGLFTETTECEWNRIFDVNAKGVFFASKYASQKMILQKSGSIVTVSSIWGQTGASCEVAYSASKAAVIGFTKAVAKELAPSNITANCVCPGVINTEMNSRFSKEDMQSIIEEIPMGFTGEPETVADVIYNISQNSYITGQVVAVNGGMYI